MDNFENFFDNHESDVEPQQSPQPLPSDVSSAPYKQKKPAQKKGHPIWRTTLSLLLVLALIVSSSAVTFVAVNKRWTQKTEQDAAAIEQMNQTIDSMQKQLSTGSAASDASNTSGDLLTPKEVYANNAESVVGISAEVQTTSFGQTTRGTASGSGFIITEDGYVVTNYHVVEDALSVSVILSGDEEYEAEIIGFDSTNDVAVLKIEAEDLPAVVLGSSDELAIGDMVVAIGNPLGSLTATLTVGYVSGKNREVTTDSTIINMIQTDAAINSGNSGGPLFNMYGEVVGITSAKYSGTTSSGASIEGIGFAIPIDDVMDIIGDLRDFGYVTGAYLGVTVQNTDASAASLYGMPTGAYVVSTVDGGSADRAGIQPKDIIIKLGDYDVSTVLELTRTLRRFKAGDTTSITVIRSGERITMDITLDEKPQEDLNTSTESTESTESMPQNGEYDEWYKYFFGDSKKG